MTVRQKLGVNLENKVVQKLKLQNVFNKKLSPNLIFLNKKRNQLIFDIEINFESTILALFEEP